MCVIVYTTINNKQILVKNRDRSYIPDIVIVHELIDGIEVAYMKDLNTGWIEGMNSVGIGIINSTLDRHDAKIETNKHKIKLKKSTRMIKALSKNNLKNVRNALLTENNNEKPFEGHTLIVYDDKCYHIENSTTNNHITTKLNNTCVFTNNGIHFKDIGYVKGKRAVSSVLRRQNILMELKNKKITSYDEILSIMNKNYDNIDPRFHSYRDKKTTQKKIKKKSKCISTTGQLLLNLTDKELLYYSDINNSKKTKYINKLPKNYNPVIKITINETEKI